MAGYKFCPQCGSALQSKELEGKQRLGCASACGYIFWDNPLPVVAAIIEFEGKALLARNKSWPEKFFGLVTGFLEREETPEEAVRREIKEELGLDTETTDLVGVYPFTQKNQVILAYHALTRGEIKIGEELAEIKLVPVEKLKPWPFGTGFAVRDWLEKRK